MQGNEDMLHGEEAVATPRSGHSLHSEGKGVQASVHNGICALAGPLCREVPLRGRQGDD